MGRERRCHKREKKLMGGEIERQRLYLERNMEQMQSPPVTHLALALCVRVSNEHRCTAEALGFILSTIKAFLDIPISLSN